VQVSDIAATAAVAKKHGATFVVDNTFLSPYFQVPTIHQSIRGSLQSSSSKDRQGETLQRNSKSETHQPLFTSSLETQEAPLV
jgi:hypothetical protein